MKQGWKLYRFSPPVVVYIGLYIFLFFVAYSAFRNKYGSEVCSSVQRSAGAGTARGSGPPPPRLAALQWLKSGFFWRIASNPMINLGLFQSVSHLSLSLPTPPLPRIFFLFALSISLSISSSLPFFHSPLVPSLVFASCRRSPRTTILEHAQPTSAFQIGDQK